MKKMKKQTEADGCINTKSSRMESLPSCLVVNDIFLRLDLENLCTFSCVSTMFRSYASQALALLPSIDFSGFSPDFATLHNILPKCRSMKTLTLNCLRIDYICCSYWLPPTIEELNLICCYSLRPEAMDGIRENCPNLRSLMLELDDCVDGFTHCLNRMLIKCGKLESFQLKIRGEVCPYFDYINFLPSTIRSLKLEPLNEDEAVKLVCGTNPSASTTFIKVNFLQTLQNLSLVLDVISDKLVLSITKFIPHLLELSLKDRPRRAPTPSEDLTNDGIQSLGTCRYLKSLFLARSKKYCQTSFKRVNDMGIFLLNEGCRELESVGLNGFSKVSDAGFASILQSCPKLKKFEVRNAELLSDLTFHGLSNAPCRLEEVKLVACNITSETVMNLSTKSSLEILNLRSCWSVADKCIKSITSLNKLICLNLTVANITDNALSALSQCSSPIKSLSLRGCVSVTDKGIVTLFHGGGTVAKTLSTLDLGYIVEITDVAIEAVAFAGVAVTELCIRGCHNVTDSSIRTLARKGQLGDGKNLPLRKLDIFGCKGLSAASVGLFKKPNFRGLWWLGFCGKWLGRGGFRFSDIEEVLKERPWLTVCADGCEMGCYDGWPTFKHHMHILGHPYDSVFQMIYRNDR